jgi:hypothetical protein
VSNRIIRYCNRVNNGLIFNRVFAGWDALSNMKWLAVVGETFGALIMLGIFFCFVWLWGPLWIIGRLWGEDEDGRIASEEET